MNRISYRRHRFHPDIIRQAVWLYFRFTMSYRDVEDLLAERGIDVTHETVRRWVLKVGRAYAHRIRRRERKMQRFKSQASAQSFLSSHGPIYNLFNVPRHLISRRTLRIFRNQATVEWKIVTAAV